MRKNNGFGDNMRIDVIRKTIDLGNGPWKRRKRLIGFLANPMDNDPRLKSSFWTMPWGPRNGKMREIGCGGYE